MTAINVRNKGVRLVRVADLEDAPWNFRDHPQAQQDALSGAVDELGWYGYPDVYETADHNLRLIDGHLRKELLLKKYGVDAEIEVNVTDFDESQAKKATMTKDPLAAMAESNGPKLDALLREVDTGSGALQEMLAALATDAGIVPEMEGDLPDIGDVDSHTFTVRYRETETKLLCDFLGVDKLPTIKTGAMILERIKEIAANRADQ